MSEPMAMADREVLIIAAALIAQEDRMHNRSACVAMKDMQYAGFDLGTSAAALVRAYGHPLGAAYALGRA